VAAAKEILVVRIAWHNNHGTTTGSQRQKAGAAAGISSGECVFFFPTLIPTIQHSSQTAGSN
jgi:hypothetical protein